MSGPGILVFGSINVDLVCRVSAIPRPGETVLSPRFERFNGGKGANQAVAAARCLGSDGMVRMAGAVGDDDFGRAAVANLQAEGIDTELVAVTGEPTGCAFITVDGTGENAITVASGANMRVKAPDVAEAAIVVLQMEIPADQNLAAARAARERNAQVVLNFAPASAAIDPRTLGELLRCTTFLVVNEVELAAVAELLSVAASGGIAQTASAVAAAAGLSVIATLGAKGALLVARGGETVESFPAPPCDVADTTGAGDTLVGAFSAFLALGRSVPDAVRYAVTAGSLACETQGAQSAMPDRNAILKAQSATA